MRIFSKTTKEPKTEEARAEETVKQEIKSLPTLSLEKLTGARGAFNVLKSFYISEKASDLLSQNQYVFKTHNGATKNEIKKQVENIFNVKVKQVRSINLPKKRRDIGKYPGFKAGFKKTIVTLKKGYEIEQAKA